jgi:hypothetical protein
MRRSRYTGAGFDPELVYLTDGDPLAHQVGPGERYG